LLSCNKKDLDPEEPRNRMPLCVINQSDLNERRCVRVGEIFSKYHFAFWKSILVWKIFRRTFVAVLAFDEFLL
jgi:hypothetical protein